MVDACRGEHVLVVEQAGRLALERQPVDALVDGDEVLERRDVCVRLDPVAARDVVVEVDDRVATGECRDRTRVDERGVRRVSAGYLSW